jgi:REP element-mobilizing transposase RayT
MNYDPQKHHRRSIRLRGYDYSSPGAYFITICSHNKQFLFGNVADGQMHRNDYGEIVQEEWFRSARIRKEIQLDAWMVMPNHVHGIVMIAPVAAHGYAPGTALAAHRAVAHGVGAHGCVPGTVLTSHRAVARAVGAHGHAPLQRRPRSLATFVGGFKGAAKKRINKMRGTPGAPVWQENYYEHIIRNEDELNKIREYILTNPLRWAYDRENPERRPTDITDDEPDWYV